MLRLSLSLLLLVSTSAAAEDWCHSRFVSADGYSISLDDQIHGRPSRAGTYAADPLWINVSGPFAQPAEVSAELTDVYAHGMTANNQVQPLELLPTDGSRFTVDTKLSTSANNAQHIRIRVGDRWLTNPADGSDIFRFNMGYALWDINSQCRFDLRI